LEIRVSPTGLYRICRDVWTELTDYHRSVLELLVLATTLLEHFEFSLPPQSEKTRIYRKPSAIMSPMTEGQAGAWMGLAIKALK
jgi:hypothetical protein